MLKIILKTLMYCVSITVCFLYWLYHAMFWGKHTVSLLTFLMFLLVMGVVIWATISSQKFLVRIFVFVTILILFFILPVELKKLYPQALENIRIKDIEENCMEFHSCAEGYKILYDNEEVVINRETCLKYGWEWYEQSKTCYTGR